MEYKPQHARRGFSLLEVSIGNTIAAILIVVTSSGMISLTRTSQRMLARARIEEEAELAAAFLAEDFSGFLADDLVGDKKNGAEVGRRVVGGSEVQICFDGGDDNGTAQWGSPDRLIRYYHSGSNLIRHDSNTGRTTNVAIHLSSFVPTDGPQGIQTQLAFLYRKETKTAVLVFPRPS
jgi:prepilin-type N-terminal cleavage/methylation domain-containing protein